MANLVVTSTTNSIKVDFGATPYSDEFGVTTTKGTWRKDQILSIRLIGTSYVLVITTDNKVWYVSYTATTGCFVIDSIDSSAPSSNSDLYDKLIALIA